MINDLLRFLADRENYSQYIKYIKLEALPSEVSDLIRFMGKYHEGGKPVECFRDLYINFAIRNSASKNLSLIESLCTATDSCTGPIDTGVVDLFQKRLTAEQLIVEATRIADGESEDFSTILKTVDEYKTKLSKYSSIEIPQEDMVSSLVSSASRTGYQWRLKALNELLGPLSTEFVVVGARPDGGKTTLFAQEAWYIAKQLPEGKTVLWFNNEQHIREVKSRVVQSVLGKNRAWIEANPITAAKQYKRAMGEENKIIFIDDAHDFRLIDQCIAKFNPGLIIIDQLYKVKGGNFGSDIEAEVFRQKCAYAREIAKHVAPVLVSNQLDASAEGVKYPPMDSLYGSKTGVQGEADAIVLLGRLYTVPDQRYLYTPKNKLTGKTDHYEITLLKEIARYE